MADKRSRHPVAPGGMWSTPKATYSKDTQSLLKEMMRESKLTNFQQRQLDKAMKDGSSLPERCHPTTSAKARVPPSTDSQKNKKTVDPREHTPILRSKDAIEESGAYEREGYVPTPLTKYGGFYEKDKQRFVNRMAYGEDLPPPDIKKIQRKMEEDDYEQKRVDRFDELQREIEDRQNFMEEMETLGQGEQYRSIIATEISQKIREMEVIDKKKTAELNRLIAQRAKEQSKAKNGIPKPGE